MMGNIEMVGYSSNDDVARGARVRREGMYTRTSILLFTLLTFVTAIIMMVNKHE